MLYSSLTTIASFGNLAFAVHVGMATMGRLLTVGMVCVLAATLVVLPAALRSVRGTKNGAVARPAQGSATVGTGEAPEVSGR